MGPVFTSTACLDDKEFLVARLVLVFVILVDVTLTDAVLSELSCALIDGFFTLLLIGSSDDSMRARFLDGFGRTACGRVSGTPLATLATLALQVVSLFGAFLCAPRNGVIVTAAEADDPGERSGLWTTSSLTDG